MEDNSCTRTTFRSQALELEYAQRWPETARGKAAAVLPWLLLPETIHAATIVGKEAWRGLAFTSTIAALSYIAISCSTRRDGFVATLAVACGALAQSCYALAQPPLLTAVQLAHAAGVTVLAAFFSGPHPRVAQMAVSGCGLAMSLAAFLGSGCRALLLLVGLLSLGWIALQLRQQAELPLRKLFLEEQRLAEKAHHFYALLSDMLPAHLIRRYFELCLVGGGPAGIGAVSMGERQPCCGVLFFQLCSFDNIVAENSAEHVVRFLNRLFSSFDAAYAEEEDGIVKVETVGGTHVSACGIFPGNDSATIAADDFDAQLAALARMALRMHGVAEDFHVAARAGLHCGPVVAGIVGDKLPRFRLFGDTVNVAARFQSQCPEGSVLVSEAASLRLECTGMQTLPNGPLGMKGLGEVQTYLLTERIDSTPITSLSDTSQATWEASPAATLLTTRHRSAEKKKSVTWHGVPIEDGTKSEASEDSPHPRRSDSAPCFQARRAQIQHSFSSDDQEGKVLQIASAPTYVGFNTSLDSTATPRSKATCSSKSLTSTRFGVSRSQTSQRISFSFSEDEDDEDFATPAHTRTKTPTAWLSFGSQLGQEDDDSLDKDDGKLIHFDSDKSWKSATSVDEATDGGADTGAPRRRTSASEASGSFASLSRTQTGLEPHGGNALGEEVVQRLEEALLEDCGLLGGFLPCFGNGADEEAFRLEQASRSLTASRAVAPYATGAAVLLVLPCMVIKGGVLVLLMPITVLTVTALALYRRNLSSEALEDWISSLCYKVLLPAKHCPHLWAAALRHIAETCSKLTAGTERSQNACNVELYAGIPVWSVALACALAALGCGGLIGSLMPWAWLLLALSQRPQLGVAMSVSVVKATLIALYGGTDCFAAPAALLVLQRAGERVERRRYKVQKLGTILSNLEAVAENLMPPSIIRELREKRFGRTPTTASASELRCVSHRYELLTVLQADLVGFTAFAKTKKPEEVVCVVNGLFSIFDKSVEQRGAFKMETIGDAYICVSGLPDYGGGVHSASGMLLLALDFIDAVAQYKVRCNLPESLGLRVGVHSGSCVGGVVGTTMQRYHLFGRTMHVAEVLESTARTGCVHLSQTTKDHANAEDMGTTLCFAPMCPPEGLVTSKGETVPQEAIGSLATFTVALSLPEQQEANTLCTPTSTPIGATAAPTLPTGAQLDELAARRLEQLDLAVQWHTAVARPGDTRLGRTHPEEDSGELLGSTPRRISSRRNQTVG